MISFKKYKCRVCHSKEIENFKLKHFTFVVFLLNTSLINKLKK